MFNSPKLELSCVAEWIYIYRTTLIEDRLERLPKHSRYFMAMRELTVQFEQWREHNGHQPWSHRSFKKALTEPDLEEGRQSSAREFINLRSK